MFEVVEKLLILQDRDSKIIRTRAELERIAPQREMLAQKLAATQSGLVAAQEKAKQLESRRKELELEVESKKAQIDKYANQQMQTKKNDEYQAFAREIDTCKGRIAEIEDVELEIMMEIDAAKAVVASAKKEADGLKTDVEKEMAELEEREGYLKKTLEELEGGRDEATSAVSQLDEAALSRYQRLLDRKGYTAIVGISRGVCGGCHMSIPAQEIVKCKNASELVGCPNCGRLLYFTSDMELPGKDA